MNIGNDELATGTVGGVGGIVIWGTITLQGRKNENSSTARKE